MKFNSLSGSTLIYLFGVGVSATISLILITVITHYLSPQEYGLFAIYQLLSTLLLPVLAFNTLGLISIEYYKQDNFLRAKLNSTIFNIFVVTVLILGAVVAIAGIFIGNLLGASVSIIVLALMTATGQFLVNWKSQLWQLERKPTLVALTLILISIINTVAAIIFVIILDGGYVARIFAQTTAVCLAAFVCVIISIYYKNIRYIRFSASDTKRVITYGFRLMPHTIGVIVVSTADRLLINENFSKSDLGVYTVALQFSLIISMAAGAFNQAYMPWLFESLSKPDIRRNRSIVQITYTFFAIAAIAVLVYAFAIGKALIFLLDPAYHGAAAILIFLCLGHAFQGMYLMVNNFVYYRKRNFSISVITIICGFFYISLLLIYMDSGGLSFVALAFSLTHLLKFLMTFGLAIHTHNMPWNLWKRNHHNGKN